MFKIHIIDIFFSSMMISLLIIAMRLYICNIILFRHKKKRHQLCENTKAKSKFCLSINCSKVFTYCLFFSLSLSLSFIDVVVSRPISYTYTYK